MDHILFAALRPYWMVPICQTPPLISIPSILTDQTKSVHVNLHTLVPRFSNSPLDVFPQFVIPCKPITCDSYLYASNAHMHLSRPRLTSPAHISQTIHQLSRPILSLNLNVTPQIRLNILFYALSNLLISFTFVAHV